MPQIKIIGERVLTLDPDRHPDRPTLEEAARREMDHAPDLLYDSGDTVYRFEIVGAQKEEATSAAPSATREPSPAALIAEIEALLARLQALVSAAS